MQIKDPGFVEWLNAPMDFVSPDPRFEFRRATPADFPRIYDLVDAVWGQSTPSAHRDWAYLKNPSGIARCSLMFEVSSRELVKSVAAWPWPIAYGRSRLEGRFAGDGVTVPRFQRQGISKLGRAFTRAHPFYGRAVSISVPNERSRGARTKGGVPAPLGPLPWAMLVLDWHRFLNSRSVPNIGARVLGSLANNLTNLWHRKFDASGSTIRVEEITRFDSSVDEPTFECMGTQTYWCPHDAEFLNWRYFDHPRHSYLAQVALVDDAPKGYSVIRIDGDHAFLMEFVAPRDPEGLARSLLRGSIEAARNAGCDRIAFYATSKWRFWKLLHQIGFVNRPSEVYIYTRHPDGNGATVEENWQLLPGDSDWI